MTCRSCRALPAGTLSPRMNAKRNSNSSRRQITSSRLTGRLSYARSAAFPVVVTRNSRRRRASSCAADPAIQYARRRKFFDRRNSTPAAPGVQERTAMLEKATLSFVARPPFHVTVDTPACPHHPRTANAQPRVDNLDDSLFQSGSATAIARDSEGKFGWLWFGPERPLTL